MIPHREREPDYSYAGLVTAAHERMAAELESARFSGWVGPAEGGWVVLVALRPRHHDLPALGMRLARLTGGPVLTADVHRDRVLTMTVARGDAEIGRYHSNPSYGRDEEDEDEYVDPTPLGVEHAPAIAAAYGRADRAEELEELMGELLDEEEQTESERLWAILRLLGLPSWLVASAALPKPVPGGPARTTLLFRGRTGRLARAGAWLAGRGRRRKR
jgi:hypothetical protein